MKTVFRVDIIESERGYGQRLEDRKFFRKEEDARDFIKEFNKENTLDEVPDTYWRAEGPRQVEIPDSKEIQ